MSDPTGDALEQLKRDNARYANAHGILVLENERLKKALETTFEDAVHPWMCATFPLEIIVHKGERNHRFLEEALELVQSLGMTAEQAHLLVDYTFGRPAGIPEQELGGVMVTLAALCNANDMKMMAAGRVELIRCWSNIEKIREKQASKPRHDANLLTIPESLRGGK